MTINLTRLQAHTEKIVADLETLIVQTETLSVTPEEADIADTGLWDLILTVLDLVRISKTCS